MQNCEIRSGPVATEFLEEEPGTIKAEFIWIGSSCSSQNRKQKNKQFWTGLGLTQFLVFITPNF